MRSRYTESPPLKRHCIDRKSTVPIHVTISQAFSSTDPQFKHLLEEVQKMVFLSMPTVENLLSRIGQYVKANHRLPKELVTISEFIFSHIALSLNRNNENRQQNAESIRNIPLFFYYIGILAKKNYLQNPINAELIEFLIENHLHLPEPKSGVDLSKFFYVIGLLIKTKKLEGHIPSSIIVLLMNQLPYVQALDGQAIAMILYGLAIHLNEKDLGENINTTIMNFLMSQLMHSEPYIDAKTWSIQSLGAIAKTGQLTEPLDSSTLQSILDSICDNQYSTNNAEQTITGLAHIVRHNNPEILSKFDERKFKMLALKSIAKQDLRPFEALHIINCFVVFEAQHALLDEAFERAVKALAITYERLSLHLRAQVDNDLNQLEHKNRRWHRLLKNQLKPETRPQAPLSPIVRRAQNPGFFSKPIEPSPRRLQTAPPPVQQNNQKRIYRLINNDNLENLAEYLNVMLTELTNPKAITTRSKPENNPLKLKKDNSGSEQPLTLNDKRIGKFLVNTEKNSLIQLIKKSRALHFELLLKACTQKQVFKWINHNYLKPIILHLPLTQLQEFVDYLNTQGQLFRDHQATIQIVNVLIERMANEPSHTRAIEALIKKLLGRTLKFHDESNHSHVVTSLLESNLYSRFLQIDLNTQQSKQTRPRIPTPPASAPMQQPEWSINLKYKYDSDELFRIFNARLAEKNLDKMVNVLKPLRMYEPESENNLVVTLTNFLNNYKDDGTKKLTFMFVEIAPDSWLLVTMNITEKKISHLVFYDYENEPANTGIRIRIVRGVKQCAADTFQFKREKALYQPLASDQCSSALFLIENGYYLTLPIKNTWQIQPDDLSGIFRKRHLVLLKNTQEEDVFETFYKKQDNSLLRPHGQIHIEGQNKSTALASMSLFKNTTSDPVNLQEKLPIPNHVLT